jgi:hypothetical protein
VTFHQLWLSNQPDKSFNLQRFYADNDLSVGRVVGKLADYVEGADGKLDYLGAFLDMSTNYFEHTGTQSMASRLIDRAVNEV